MLLQMIPIKILPAEVPPPTTTPHVDADVHSIFSEAMVTILIAVVVIFLVHSGMYHVMLLLDLFFHKFKQVSIFSSNYLGGGSKFRFSRFFSYNFKLVPK